MCIDLLPKLIEDLESIFPLNVLKNEEYAFITEICSVKEKHKIITRHNYFELLNILVNLKLNKYPSALSVFKKINTNFNELPSEKLEFFLSNFFNNFITLITNDKDFYYTFLFVFQINNKTALILFFNALVKDIKKTNSLIKIKELLKFYFEIDQYKFTNNVNYELKVEEFVFEVLLRLDKNILDNLNEHFINGKTKYNKKAELLFVNVFKKRGSFRKKGLLNIFNLFFKNN